MAEFPPNLDDGELWLPSDIFLSEVPSIYNNNNNLYHFSSSMDDLASHFAAFSLLQNHPPKPPLNSQRLKLAVRDNFHAGFWGLEGGAGPEFDPRIYGFGNGNGSCLVQKPGNAYRVDNDRYMDTRNRVLLRRQVDQNPIQNRVYNPFQRSGGLGYCGGGGVKESGGTGVFHPRNVNPATALAAGGVDIKRKQGERNSMRKVGVKKQEECYYHLPPEMGLPKDWSY